MSTNSEWPEGAAPPVPAPVVANPASSENPPWSGWDVLRIGLVMFVVPYVILPVVAVVAQKIFFRSLSITDVAQKPWIALGTQFAWYLVVAAYMIMFVEGKLHQGFWPAIRWIWPSRYWP